MSIEICECHMIDWSRGPLDIRYIDTGEPCPLEDGISCQDKVNLGIISKTEFYKECKYIPGKPGSKLPSTFIVSPASPAYNNFNKFNKQKIYIIGRSILNIKEKPNKTKPKILNLIIEMNNIN